MTKLNEIPMSVDIELINFKYSVSRFLSDAGAVRHIFQDKVTRIPSTAVSLYEAFLTNKSDSYNTVKAELDGINYFCTWSDLNNIPMERLLLRGQPLKAAQLRSFAYWLKRCGYMKNGRPKQITIDRYNRILGFTCEMICWFFEQYGGKDWFGTQHYVNTENVMKSIKDIFKKSKKKNKKIKIAPDMTDDEIAKINNFLKPENRTNVAPEIALRDFLIWRLVIEFGLREGEVLALRLQDLPYGNKKYIKIVRIEDRGADYKDPRGKYAPRPKTLSHDLGFLLMGTATPHLLNDYITKDRRIRKKNGKSDWDLGHDFLIIDHSAGRPLSVASMTNLADEISDNTGIDFHWHLGRHAFFNRAYAAIINNPKFTERKQDLVDWGGWSDEKSLLIYSNRARRDAARNALLFWQIGANEWEALK